MTVAMYILKLTMASFDQHRQDCIRFLGADHAEVHRWLDECFKDLGPLHRKMRHHREGIQEAVSIFGDGAKDAASIHILRDCRHIPTSRDYKVGLVDPLGLKQSWSTAAYIRYSDKEFEDLVREHLKPSALLLWAFLRWDDAATFLSTATTLEEEDIVALEPAWNKARAHLDMSTHSPTIDMAFLPLASSPEAETEAGSYLRDVFKVSNANNPNPDGHGAEVGYISSESLGDPFIYIDYELLEDLKPELSGSSALEVAAFALPKRVTAPMVAVGDGSMQNVTFISRQKTITVSNVRLKQTDEGTEVSYIVSAASSGIVASKYGEKYILRNGVHRAHLLAQLGIKQIPCIMIEEANMVPLLSSPYPTFTPNVLLQPRAPMMSDFLKPELCLQVPLRRTNRLIRISADATNIPVE